MSWARTTVSTGMTSRFTRCRATMMTATPVTNIARVESMNGAPRIAPTPTPWDSDEPPPVRIAMIGIIVSGNAVPTAARTEPTAPSASSSFRPNHSMPFVNSSAPMRMITNAAMRMRMSTSGLEAAGEHDAQRDDDEDRDGDGDHLAFASPDVADERCHDPRGGRRDDREQAEPDEAGRSEVGDVIDHEPRGEPRAAGERRDSAGKHDDDPDREERHRAVRSDRQEAGDRSLEVDGRRLVRVAGHCRARWSICQAV